MLKTPRKHVTRVQGELCGAGSRPASASQADFNTRQHAPTNRDKTNSTTAPPNTPKPSKPIASRTVIIKIVRRSPPIATRNPISAVQLLDEL